MIDSQNIFSEIIKVPADYDMLCILGPTASGKTKFAVECAKKISDAHLQNRRGGFQNIEGQSFVAEIISADSRQVYRGMDIGTGKDLVEYDGVPYHLIDIVEAGEKYNVFRYKQDFQKVYDEIVARGAFPILCGGSGLYIEAVCTGYELKEVAPDHALREELEKKEMPELIQMLAELKQATTLSHTTIQTLTARRELSAQLKLKKLRRRGDQRKVVYVVRTQRGNLSGQK